MQHKAKIAKLSSFFLTNTSWDCVGGLPGMLLTVADQSPTNSSFRIVGPEGLHHFVGALRHFVFRAESTVELEEIREIPPYIPPHKSTVRLPF